VTPWKYNKLISNLANAVVALTGSESASEVTASVRREGEEVLADAGIEFVSFEVSKASRANGPNARPVPGAEDVISNSTWQSLARNSGSIETDFLNGEIARIAHQHGRTAPINATLARLAREAARSGRGPGEYTVEQLGKLLGVNR
jgi:2-dehydropantoate 2-reductase